MNKKNNTNTEEINDENVNKPHKFVDKYIFNPSFFFYVTISLAIYTIILGFINYRFGIDLIYRAILMITVSFFLLVYKYDAKKWGLLYVACFIHSIVQIFVEKKTFLYVSSDLLNMFGCLIIVLICDNILTYSKKKIIVSSSLIFLSATLIFVAFLWDLLSTDFIRYLQNPPFYISNTIINLLIYLIPTIIILIHPEYIAGT